jgi:hypothetical protein
MKMARAARPLIEYRASSASALCSAAHALASMSQTKLVKVVVNMQISPAHPLPLGEITEYRVGTELEVALWMSEALNEALELSKVSAELHRLRSTDLLVDFG